MEQLSIKKTSCTPKVHLDRENGILFFSGNFNPMEGSSYYAPLIKWIKNYARDPHTTTRVKIYVESISTSSAKFLVLLFRILSGIQHKKKGVLLEWLYDDADDISDWKDLLGNCNFPVKYRKTEKALAF
ncbi:SiaC family regulatory phosphoprotein [Bacteroidota bacterium]